MKAISLSLFIMLVFGVTSVIGGAKGEPASVLIDVRTEAEWNAGHLEGAILIPHDRIAQDIARNVKDKKTKIYLYCRSGRRTALAADELKRAGYEDIVNMGIMEDAAKKLNRQILK